MSAEKVLLIARAGVGTSIIHNALKARFSTEVILEEPPSMWNLLRSRAKRLGLGRVFGQVLFQVLVAQPMSLFSQKRSNAILKELRADDTPPPSARVHAVASVNNAACHALVQELSPRVIVINGTRILSRSTLDAFQVPVLNTHVGITPAYRGVHGAYWALVNDDPEHCGVTVHLVDAGIDTGAIIHQGLIEPTKQDNFTTYPLLQMAVGSQLLCQAVEEVLAGNVRTIACPTESRRWFHPTIWEYASNRLRRGVR